MIFGEKLLTPMELMITLAPRRYDADVALVVGSMEMETFSVSLCQEVTFLVAGEGDDEHQSKPSPLARSIVLLEQLTL